MELDDIEFPSKDGFILKPHVMVEYAVKREKVPEMLVRLTDEGTLHQEDSTPEEQARNEILQKVILPNIRGYARIEGSNFEASHFIGNNPSAEANRKNARLELQQILERELKEHCDELGIELRAVSLGEMKPPATLTEQIAQRDIAQRELEKNTAQISRLKEVLTQKKTGQRSAVLAARQS